MEPALSQLLMMRFRGGLRYRVRQLSSLRGLFFFLIVAGVVWLLVGADDAVVGTYLPSDPAELQDYVRTYMPLGLLSACLFTAFVATGPALYYSQNEINFLFAGPFSRRGLVIYKIWAYAAGAILSALIITLLIPSRASTGMAAFVGMLLTLIFIQLSSAAIKLAGLVFDESAFMRAKRPAIVVVVAAAIAYVLYATNVGGQTLDDVISGFRDSWVGIVLAAPFATFAELVLARNLFPDLLGWSMVAIAINLALLYIVIALDARTHEHAFTESRRLGSRWLRIARGGSFWASNDTTARSIATAPTLGGIGPIAWRQTINAIRNSGRVIAVFVLVAIVAGPLALTTGVDINASESLGFVYFFIAFVMPRTLVCDFRGEMSRMEQYKALPLAPWRICVSQLIVPVAVASLILSLMIACTLPFLDLTTAVIFATLLLFVVPFCILLYGIENLVSLLFPTKLVPFGRVDFDFLGRALIDFVAKTLVIFSAVGFARRTGIVLQDQTDGSQVALVTGAWLTLTLISLMTIPALAFAFRRFSVSDNAD
jgi:hypothetical protein